MIFDDFHGSWVCPSILSADFLNISNELESLQSAGVDAIHLDIMDGHFVPNISFGPAFVEAVRRGTNLPLIAHLMVTDPLTYGQKMAKAGVEAVSFHIETAGLDLADRFREMGIAAGVAIKPSTTDIDYESIAKSCDFVLVMSVEPGFSGQSFKPVALERIARFAELRDKLDLNLRIEVDGGVNGDNARSCLENGADLLVSASYLLGHPDRAAAVKNLRI